MQLKRSAHLIHSFKYAFEGIYSAIKTETNWQIGFIQALVVIILGFYFQISKLDWIIVMILIGLVLTTELLNSAIEAIVDSFTSDIHPGAKLAKDFAAGAVVIMILASGVAGLIVFLPYLT